MYVYVTEIRTIQNISKPTLGGIPTKITGDAVEGFPDNFKPSIKIENDNTSISSQTGRPYFMFGWKYCEFDIAWGTSEFEDLNKNFLSFDFISRISFKKNGETFIIKFPIKHVNLNEKNKEWQVETGHIIFPILNKDSYTLMPYYVFFNSFQFSQYAFPLISLSGTFLPHFLFYLLKFNLEVFFPF